MAVFGTQSLIKQTLFQRMFNKLPKRNYLIELENKLSENEDKISTINKNEVEVLKQKYKISNKDFKTEREMLLDKLISRCLWDNRLSDDEKNQLNCLCNLLELPVEYLNNKILEEGKLIYRNKVKCVIEDNRVEESEKEDLENIKNEFSINDDIGDDIYGSECQQKIQSYVDEIIKKRRMSPEEDKKLQEMISELDIKVSFNGNGLDTLKEYWQVENGELKELESPINIQKSEKLYFKQKINWYEERKQITYVSYSGLTSNIRICKGLNLRAGAVAPSRHTEDVMKLIDSGEVFFTNKRIIFMGEHGNKNIPYSKVLAIVPYTNGIQIEKDTGKSPFFECNNAELMGIYIARLLKDF